MQYRVYDGHNLSFVDSGYIRGDYVIDKDYIVDKQSVCYLLKPSKARVGDVITLIKDTGSYDKGVVTAVDKSEDNPSISYKDMKELFNDTTFSIEYLYRKANGLLSSEDEIAVAADIDVLGALIEKNWITDNIYDAQLKTDENKIYPMTIEIVGSVGDINDGKLMLFNEDETSVNFKDLLIDIFMKYKVVISVDIDFDMSNSLTERQPKYKLVISLLGGRYSLIKDNIKTQTFTFEEEQLPSKTVCVVLDGDTKETISVWWLLDDNTVINTSSINFPYDTYSKRRVLPVRTSIIEFSYDENSDLDEDNQIGQAVFKELASDTYYHSIQMEISKSAEFEYIKNLALGDRVTIVTQNGTIDTIYTGKKEKGNEDVITLYFGLGRTNFVSKIIQIMREERKKSHSYLGLKRIKAEDVE